MNDYKVCGNCEYFETVLNGFCRLKVMTEKNNFTNPDRQACEDWTERTWFKNFTEAK